MKCKAKTNIHKKNRLVSLSIIFVFLLLLVNQPIYQCISIDIQESLIEDSDMEILTSSRGVEFVRTPDSFFENLPDWPYEGKYVEIDGLRQAYAEVGSPDGEVILLLHGQPSWSYLYRKMIPILSDAGYRVIAMDHLGMGRSDKPIDLEYHSYDNHVYRLEQFIEKLQLENITAFVQDWGSLIGLDVIGNHPELFSRVVVGDGTILPIPDGMTPFSLPEDPEEQAQAIERFEQKINGIPAQQPEFYNNFGYLKLKYWLQNLFNKIRYGNYFSDWILYAREYEDFKASTIVEAMTYFPLTDEELDAYDAPFPNRTYMAAPRTFPGLVNELGGKTQSAIDGLKSFTKPFLTIWAGNDPGNLGSKRMQQYLIWLVPGSENQPHTRLPEASHFLQDDQGTEIARLMVDFMNESEKVGYELINLLTKEVWATGDFTKEEYEAFSPPFFWMKNDPRIMIADQAEFLKSPGCDEDGQFTYMQKFNKEFLKVVQLKSMNKPADSEGLIRRTELEKYHVLTYDSGQNVNIIKNPSGERFIEVSRSLNRYSDTFTLPEGWILTSQFLEADLQVELLGSVSVLRTDNEDSYQGPIPDDLKL